MITLVFVALPFLFLLVFTQITEISFKNFLFNVALSSWRLLLAYFFAVALAFLCAILFYRGRSSTIALPLFDVLQSFPTFAALPIAAYFWGASNFTVVFFLIITIIWPIFFSLVSTLRLAKSDWHDVASIYKISGRDYFVEFLLPLSIPGLITGSIIGLGEGWEALVATEIIVGTPTGLGSFFRAYSQNFSITAFGIVTLLFIIFSFNKLVWLPLLDWSHERLGE